MNSISRTLCLLGAVLSLFVLLLGYPSPSARADGGAPQLAYVAGAAPGVSIIDIAKQRVTGSFALSGDPHAILLSPDGSMLYVTQPGLGRVAVIAAKTGKTLCTASLPGQPSLLALKLDATVLYVAGRGDTSVRALNPMNCAVEHTFETHSPIYGLAVTASTAPDATPSTPNQLWITGASALTVFEVNGHLLGTVPIADGPQYICIPGLFTAYVTTRQGTVVAVDLNTRQVIRTLLRGGPFGTMDYDATTGEVYVPDQQRDQLDVLAPVALDTPATTQEPARVLPLSGSPQAVAITNDGGLGFVALSNGQVLMLDIPERKMVASFVVGGTPHFIITGTYPPGDSLPQQAVPSSSLVSSLSGPLLILSAALVGFLVLGALLLFGRWSWQRSAARKRL